MLKLKITEQITISQPKEAVHAIISDFHTWNQWSPWLIAEPNATVTVAANGSSYSWDGEIVGAGKMVFDSIEASVITIDLKFLKPWKSTAKVAFHLAAEGNTTHVSWTMESKLPFFLFWMKKSIMAYIAMDYQRGLLLLKDYIELKKLPFNIAFDGFGSRNALAFVGFKRKCSTEDASRYVGEDFQALMPYLYQQHKKILIHHAFTMYSKWDVVNKVVEYTIGHTVSALPEQLLEHYITGTLAGTKTHNITYTGPYRHIANVWAIQMMYVQNKHFKSQKKIAPVEFYHNSPMDTPEEKLITQVQFAVA